MNRGDRQPSGHSHGRLAKRMTAGALVLLAIGALPLHAADWHWNAANGEWSDSSKWLPNSAPADDAHVFIGSLAGVQNATVTLDTATDADALIITDGMTLTNDHRSMHVQGTTVVSGETYVGSPGGFLTHYPSRLLLDSVDGLSFWTHDLNVIDGGRVQLNNSYVNVDGVLSIGQESRMTGVGATYLTNTGTVLTNNGTLDGGGSSGLEFYAQGGNGHFDLDGASGDGVLLMDLPGDNLTFVGTALADSFSGNIVMVSDTTLNMALSTPWVADANSVINVTGLGEGMDRALIAGTSMTLAGDLIVGGNAGELRLLPSVTVAPTAEVHVGAGSRINFEGDLGPRWLTVEGGEWQLDETARIDVNDIAELQDGDFTLGRYAHLIFNEDTEINGGTFTTYSTSFLDGAVNFNGHTTWDGVVHAHGVMRQTGDATVAGPTVINADVFDMDGMISSTWAINNGLVINAASIEAPGFDIFNGTLNVTGGFFGKLTVNLADPAAAWTMAGSMNLTGDNSLFITRVAGSPLNVSGDLRITGGKAQITADTIFADPSSIDFAAPSASLRLTGRTSIEAGAAFTGEGTLFNGVAGEMTLGNGVAFDDVGLTNNGTLEIVAGGAGVASMDRFTTTGQWVVDIGGYVAGHDYDLLLVDGQAALGGLIQVNLSDLGGIAFAPQIGDEFTVLYSLGGVTGMFAGDPTTTVGDLTYEWSVLYGAHGVTLRLDEILPEPATAATMLLGLCLCTARSRGRKPLR